MLSKRIGVLAVGLWLSLAAAYLDCLWQQGLNPVQALLAALHWLKTEPWAPAAFILAFVGRPIVLIPAAVMAVTAGHCFGAVGGEFWALLAGNVSGAVVYFLGRLWRNPAAADSQGPWKIFLGQLSERGMETTATMRVALLPYDPVSFVCGKYGVPLGAFSLGTLLGNLPATTSCVLFGAGVKGDFDGTIPAIDWGMQAWAVAILLLAFALKAWIKKRQM